MRKLNVYLYAFGYSLIALYFILLKITRDSKIIDIIFALLRHIENEEYRNFAVNLIFISFLVLISHFFSKVLLYLIYNTVEKINKQWEK